MYLWVHACKPIPNQKNKLNNNRIPVKFFLSSGITTTETIFLPENTTAKTQGMPETQHYPVASSAITAPKSQTGT